MYAHERSLVEKYKGRPFALLGVNTDAKEDVPEIIKTENIVWRSWCDGSDSGPISTEWRIKTFPSVFLLDHEGVIRHKGTEELDEAIEGLVASAESELKIEN